MTKDKDGNLKEFEVDEKIKAKLEKRKDRGEKLRRKEAKRKMMRG